MILILTKEDLTHEAKKLPIKEINIYHIKNIDDVKRASLVFVVIDCFIKIIKDTESAYRENGIYLSEALDKIIHFHYKTKNNRHNKVMDSMLKKIICNQYSNETLIEEIELSKISEIISDKLKDIFINIVLEQSKKYLNYLSEPDRCVFEANAYNACCEHYTKFNPNKSDKAILYLRVIIRSSFASSLVKLKKDLK